MRFDVVEYDELVYLKKRNFKPSKDCIEVAEDGHIVLGCEGIGNWSLSDEYNRMEDELNYVDGLLLKDSFFKLNNALAEELTKGRTTMGLKLGGIGLGAFVMFLFIVSLANGSVAW